MIRSAKAWAALALVLAVLFTTVTGALAGGDPGDVLDLVNQERKEAGLKTVALSDDLNRVAQLRAEEIVKQWSHTRPNGEEWKSAFSEAGVSASYRGENLAKGQGTPDAVVEAWMNSEGHRDNILNKKFTKMGLACIEINGITYWVQVFADDVKTAKKASTSSSKSTKNSGAKDSSGAAPAPAPAPAPDPAPSGSTQSTGRAESAQTGALDKFSQSDLQAAMSAPAATPTVGKNPAL